jgi:hypothetical protein
MRVCRGRMMYKYILIFCLFLCRASFAQDAFTYDYMSNAAAAAAAAATTGPNVVYPGAPAAKAAYAVPTNKGYPPGISDTAAYDLCRTAASTATATCTSPQGIGAQSAAAIQNIANMEATQQLQEGQAQAAGGVTVVNVTNNGQQQNPAANAACSATKLMGEANMASDVVASSFCMHAHAACATACNTTALTADTAQGPETGKNYATAFLNQCENAMHVFEAQVIPQALNGAIVAQGGAACNTNLAANGAPPPLAAPPGMPAFDEPGNVGYQGNPAASPSALGPGSDGSGGGSSLPTAGYPGGATDKNAQAAGGSSIKDHDLGLAGGGGMVPFANNGSGSMPGKSGDPAFDLGSLFCKDREGGICKDGGATRMPAGINEVTGANDLTNFQKVTRMMNKKRPTLKNGDGA